MPPMEYGKMTKRIVFTESDHRHAQLLIKLKQDGLRQSEFFRSIVTGYLSGDERVDGYIQEISSLSQQRKKKTQKLRTRGEQVVKDFGLNEGEIENIFDLIEQEYPDL